tara:strand:+ start:347 stop:772 length:426 start_codon:yes stop_codon:yes gene_type:complete
VSNLVTDKIQNLYNGKAGEHFTCFDILSQGYNATLVDTHFYDVLLNLTSSNFIKIQVKTSNYHRGKQKKSIRYVIARKAGNKVQASYDSDMIDIFAFVSPKLKKVAYIPLCEIQTTNKVTIQCAEFDNYTLDRALSILSSI